jgi:NAD(P)-dependent dehydrogenase (short-subunit alcohol dehydrogenase family)
MPPEAPPRASTADAKGKSDGPLIGRSPGHRAWSTADIPRQTGRTAIVTGTGGLGYNTALELARAGAAVILAGRNPQKGHEAIARIQAACPEAAITFEPLDLANLASIADFADRMSASHSSIDLLINNAGVMALPTRKTTADGFELQLGTNHLGHFALTARLLPLLRQGKQPRVVKLSSLAHRGGSIHFDDLQWERRYKPWPAYQQSKLANLLFTFELQRRSDAGAWGLMSLAAHPGFARTDLIANGMGTRSALGFLSFLLGPVASQSSAAGALPILFAATSPDAVPGGYYGPSGLYEMKGPPTKAFVAKQALDTAAAKKLWDISQQAVGPIWPQQ